MAYKAVKVLMMDARLTVIRSKKDAESVLREVRRQGVPLVFMTSDTSKAVFQPIETVSGDAFRLWEPDTSMDIPVELQPSIRVTDKLAIDELFRRRKHFNRHWKGDE